MPPRFPNGLKRDPMIMSLPEKVIFGALSFSVGMGLFQLIKSPWTEQSKTSYPIKSADTDKNNVNRLSNETNRD